MPPAVPLVAAAAGAAATSAGIGTALFGAGVLGSIGAAITANSIAGFVVATGVNQIGSRLFTKKPKSPSLAQDAGIRTALIRSSTESHKIVYGQALVGGTLVYAKTTNSGLYSAQTGPNRFLHLVIVLAGHEVEEIGQMYLNDQDVSLVNGYVTSPPYYDATQAKSFIRVVKHLGEADQPADDELIAQVPEWTEAHRLRGLAYVYIRLEYRSDIFIRGIPEPKFVVKGKKVYDPRSATTAWSDNAALCVRDYLTADYGFNAPTKVNDTYFTAAANVCDESVVLNAGGTESRYTCNGVLDTESTPIDNLQSLLSSMAGVVTDVQGRFRLHAAAYDAPAGDLTTDMLAGDMQVQFRPERKDVFNAVRGVFVDPTKSYQPTDFPPVTNATYAADDGGDTIYQDIELPFTIGSERAQRIAKIGLEKARQGIVVTLPVNYKALKYAVMDVVTLTSSQLGWASKPFRVKKWGFALTGGIVMTLQEESSASYDWNSGEATTADPAPDTDLPDPFFVAPPKALEVTEETYVTTNGTGVKARAVLTWLASPDAFLKDYVAEYKLSAGSEWTLLPRTEATTQTVDDVAPGIYDFRVRAINGLTVPSAYATATKEISGLLAPPTQPVTMTLNSIGGLALIRWEPTPDLDVRIGGRYVFRHSAVTSGAGWHEGVSIGNPVPGSATHALFPLKAGTYMARAEDSSGVQSTDYSSVTTEQATALAYSPVDELVEDPVFSGAKVSCFVDDAGALRLEGAGSVDDAADFDAILDFDSYGGVVFGGFYTFSAVMDLGSVKKVRLTSRISSTIVNVLDFFDSREEDVDDWPTFDGDSDALADAYLNVYATPDDPTGTPTYADPVRLESAEFEARAFLFVLNLFSDSTNYNIVIDGLSVTAEEIAP